MSRKIKLVGQFRDAQVELQMIEIIKTSQALLDASEDAYQNILDINSLLENIETKQGATEKANIAEQNAKYYTDEKAKPSGGGTTLRPAVVDPFTCYFDTTLEIPIWWTGSKWVNAQGVEV